MCQDKSQKDIPYQEPQEEIEISPEVYNTSYWKKMTHFLFQICKWSKRYYFNLIDSILISNKSRSPEYLFGINHHDCLNFYKKAISLLDQHGLIDFEKEELIFQDKDEEDFYNALPNDEDLLLDGIYFFLMPQEEQIAFLCSTMASLAYAYESSLPSKRSIQENDLLREFRLLSKPKQKQVIEFVSFLLYK